jgi:hypothetical protein
MPVAALNERAMSPAPPSVAGNERPVRGRAITWSILAVLLVETLYALWTASRGYFLLDDFIDLQTMRHLGLGWHLFEQPVFGHFIPGFTFVDYLVSLISPYQWWVMVLIEVSLFALSLLLLTRLLTILFGPSWLNVLLIALAGASFSLVPSLVWWSTALEYLVAVPAALLALICHVRYVGSGGVRYVVFGTFSIAVGLAFYDGFFVSVFFMALMTVLMWPVGPGMPGAARTFALYWRAWVCYGIPIAMDLAWRFAHPSLYLSSFSSTLDQALTFVVLSWTQTFVPLTIGVYVWLLPVHVERVVAGVLGQALLVVFVVGTVLRRRAAWRAWLLLGGTFLVSAALVGLTRAGVYGPGDAGDVKYVTLDVFFLAISLGFALLPVRPLPSCSPTGRPPADPASDRGRMSMQPPAGARPSLRALVCLVALALVPLYGVAMVFDQDRYPLSVAAHTSHRFFTNVAASWRNVAQRNDDAFLWDTEINPVIVTPAFFPYDTASLTVGQLYPEIRFDTWGGEGYLLRSNGSIVRARAVMQAIGVLTDAGGACAGPGDRRADIVVALDHDLRSAKRWFGIVSYTSPTGTVATQSGGTHVVFAKGEGTVITTLPPDPLTSISWNVDRNSRVCITGVKVVLPEPVGTSRSGDP